MANWFCTVLDDWADHRFDVGCRIRPPVDPACKLEPGGRWVSHNDHHRCAPPYSDITVGHEDCGPLPRGSGEPPIPPEHADLRSGWDYTAGSWKVVATDDGYLIEVSLADGSLPVQTRGRFNTTREAELIVLLIDGQH